MSECAKCKYEQLLFDAHVDWETTYDGDYDYKTGTYQGIYRTFKRNLSNGSVVETIDKHDKDSWAGGYYDGEYPQGSEFDAWVILKVTQSDGSVLYFRKGGKANSYGTVSWDKPLREVKVVEKTIQVFETVFEVV